MASQNYLIAIALIEQNLVRAMPLGGKEIKDNLEEPENFKKLGEEVILNLFFAELFVLSFGIILRFYTYNVKNLQPILRLIKAE